MAEKLEPGAYETIKELADAENINDSYVLAPYG
jgi:hypothetical protein